VLFFCLGDAFFSLNHVKIKKEFHHFLHITIEDNLGKRIG